MRNNRFDIETVKPTITTTAIGTIISSCYTYSSISRFDSSILTAFRWFHMWPSSLALHIHEWPLVASSLYLSFHIEGHIKHKPEQN